MDKIANVEQTDGHGESLEQVEQRLRCWREGRKQGGRIPPALWAAAVSMAKEHGVHRISRELRQDYNRLKQRVVPAGAATGAPMVEAQFVELFAAPASKAPSVSECIVELHNVRGAKMRGELNAGGLAGLASLCNAFWGAA